MNRANPIAVFGEALVDDFGAEQVVGGAPFNVARSLAAFGQAVRMITRIGNDQVGEAIAAEFARFGLDTVGLQVGQGEDSGRVTVERANGEHRFIILPDQAYDHIAGAAAVQAAGEPATIYFGTLAQRSSTSRDALYRLLRATGAQRYLDLNVRAGQVTERCVYESLREADIVKVNEEELRDLFGWYTHTRHTTADMDDPLVRIACQSLLRTFSLRALIVTLGPRGAMYFDADDGVVVSRPAVQAAAPLIDTVGAGDAFSAVFLLGQARGWPVELTLARANEFAGAVCTISGAVPGEMAFYTPFMARWFGAEGAGHAIAA